jgi:outer membrane biosynthesis protein TonB
MAAPTSAPAAAAQVQTGLRLIAREQPSFPQKAIRQGIVKGHVRVRLSVGPDGSVTHVEVTARRIR